MSTLLASNPVDNPVDKSKKVWITWSMTSHNTLDKMGSNVQKVKKLPYNGSYRIVVGLYISPHIKAVKPFG